MVPVILKVRLPPHPFILLMPLKPKGQKKQKRLIYWLEKLISISKENQGLLLIQWWQRGLHLEPRGFSRVLVTPCPILKLNEKLHQPKNRTIKH